MQLENQRDQLLHITDRQHNSSSHYDNTNCASEGIFHHSAGIFWAAHYAAEASISCLCVNPAELDSARSNNPLLLPLALHTSNTTSPTTTPFYRSLTSPSLINGLNMTTTVPAPGSPPGLTGSKSSKSSSFQSSSYSSSIDGITSDISNFEDIGLDDDRFSGHDPYGAYGKRLDLDMDRTIVAQRPSLGQAMSGNSSGSRAGPQRELITGNKSENSILNRPTNRHSSDNPGLGLPNGGAPRRGLTSPSTPSLMIGLPRRPRSRSPSPGLCASPSPMSPNPFTRGTPLLRQSSSPKPPHSRRGSWQPNRKTIKELEAECHDSDEEVDDNAVIWNVPMTPRPAQERSKSANVSAKASANTSPERQSLSSTSVLNRIERLSMETSAPPSIEIVPGTNRTTPVSPAKPNLPRGASMGALPDHFGNFPKTRVKSWNAALSDLSEEARFLTEALEAHADIEERQRAEDLQKGGSSPRPTFEKQRAKATISELPPVRRSNVMIDPLPISKEKEKVLTRTRPSWLPPKCQKEEKRHLREYQRMMTFSLESEKRRAAKEAEAQQSRETNQSSLSRIWDQHVLPNWDRVIDEPRTRELWWRGVSPRSRGVVWQKALGNELSLTEASYDAALTRAKNAQRQQLEQKDQQARHQSAHSKESAWFAALERDVGTTFPELRVFQKGGPLNEALVDVLMAYSMYRSDVGYTHGTNLLAALLLLSLTPPHAFITLANLLNRPLPLAFLTNDTGAIARTYSLTLSLLAQKLPRLHAHLVQTLALPPEALLKPLFKTLFLQGLGVDVGSRVLDVYVFEGDALLVRTALGVFVKEEARFWGGREEIIELLKADREKWHVGGEEEFMRAVREVGKMERRGG